MTYEDYTTILAPLFARYQNAKHNHCVLTANARIRDMAKLYAEYRRVDVQDAYKLFKTKLENNEIVPL